MLKRFGNSLTVILSGLILGFLLHQCANPVTPIGGPKDEDPPQVIASNPANYSINFKEKSIEITFDEFVKLSNTQKQVLISPPLKTNPEYRLRGKTLRIRFEEELLEETTYTLFFGDAIGDLTENNPLSGFSFVFSTGSVIDSMSIEGIVRNAFDLVPPEEAYVMLYDSAPDTIPVDSLPYLLRPLYVARTDAEGHFRLANLKDTAYKIFVLSDMNSNFRYDMPGEKIAFLDSLIKPVYQKMTVYDSLLLLSDSLKLTQNDSMWRDDSLMMIGDSLLVAADSLRNDSLPPLESALDLQLFMFEEQDSVQRLLRTELIRKGLLRFAFRYPVRDLIIEPMRPLPDSFNLIDYYSAAHDTLFWYFNPTISDSLFLTIRQDTVLQDTIQLSLAEKKSQTSKRKNDEEEKPARLSIQHNAKGRKIDLPKQLRISFDEPVTHLKMRDTSWFIINQDTLLNQIRFVQSDSIGLNYTLDTLLTAESSYTILLPDSVFFGYSGKTNDTTLISFSVPAEDQYGHLYLDFTVPDTNYNYILQLLSNKEQLLNQRIVNKSQMLHYPYLTLAKYLLKIIQDSNKNGRWDTGDYLKKQQPELVNYFPKEIEIRANWDFEESWEPKFNNKK
ncbi:MAG: Ig-like domain-containing protein [Bacteroidetes bacterium]|nr:Ig-like domain-containing protein [Bacteroidota bacterium]MBU1579589.1 Ig-like domain-containing protein [Bacteroidota bacterium]MBU2465824.1 Ig-like domain-containing protein [Bacteroidota bacterium]MBU2558739.1 Ig-like domain-containing protein [Bacteroidota bacterium]